MKFSSKSLHYSDIFLCQFQFLLRAQKTRLKLFPLTTLITTFKSSIHFSVFMRDFQLYCIDSNNKKINNNKPSIKQNDRMIDPSLKQNELVPLWDKFQMRCIQNMDIWSLNCKFCFYYGGGGWGGGLNWSNSRAIFLWKESATHTCIYFYGIILIFV